MRWILVEAMDRVLPEIGPACGRRAPAARAGIDIRLGTTLEEVTALGTDLHRWDCRHANRRLDRQEWSRIPAPATWGWPSTSTVASWSTTTCA